LTPLKETLFPPILLGQCDDVILAPSIWYSMCVSLFSGKEKNNQ